MSNLPHVPHKEPGSVRLIAAADLHLGRLLPLPDIVKNSFLTPEGAWEQLVDLALDPSAEINGLILAGDIFDREENVLEAPFSFEQGMKRLEFARKPVIAIAGNHDWRSLRKRHRLLGFSHFHVLGQGNAWESCDLEFHGRKVRFEGWSFPSSQYFNNPLDTLPKLDHDLTTIGLLHGDWEGKAGSPYAPFSIKQLVSSGRSAWVLGHIHIPKTISEDPPIVSCGSLQGLDPSEQGERGAFLLDIKANGEIAVTMIPLAAMLWQTLSLDITSHEVEECEIILQKALEKDLRASVKALSVDVVWKGRIKSHEAKEVLKRVEGMYFSLQKQEGLIDCHVRKSTLEVLPFVDLQLLAREHSMIGFAAREILLLEENEELEKVKTLFAKESALYPSLALPFDHDTLKRQAYEVLFDLLEQREGKR